MCEEKRKEEGNQQPVLYFGEFISGYFRKVSDSLVSVNVLRHVKRPHFDWNPPPKPLLSTRYAQVQRAVGSSLSSWYNINTVAALWILITLLAMHVSSYDCHIFIFFVSPYILIHNIFQRRKMLLPIFWTFHKLSPFIGILRHEKMLLWRQFMQNNIFSE